MLQIPNCQLITIYCAFLKIYKMPIKAYNEVGENKIIVNVDMEQSSVEMVIFKMKLVGAGVQQWTEIVLESSLVPANFTNTGASQ